eukprot:1187960-Prorocentrum_minimum.AAC.4
MQSTLRQQALTKAMLRSDAAAAALKTNLKREHLAMYNQLSVTICPPCNLPPQHQGTLGGDAAAAVTAAPAGLYPR